MSLLFRQLHQALSIPDGYYRAEAPDAPPIDPILRRIALDKLRKSGELRCAKSDDPTAAVIEAMCKRFQRWVNEPAPYKGTSKVQSISARLEKAKAFIPNNPNMSRTKLMLALQCSKGTIDRARSELKAEGK